MACSTPQVQEPWTVVRGSKSAPQNSIQLSNTFLVLDETEASTMTVPLSPQTVPAWNRSSLAAVNPRSQVSCHPSMRRLTCADSERPRPKAKLSAPSLLILGDSMVRHVSLLHAETICYPGARVLDINSAISPVLHHHSSVSSVLVHVGSNDISNQQSEILKDNFKTLILILFYF